MDPQAEEVRPLRYYKQFFLLLCDIIKMKAELSLFASNFAKVPKLGKFCEIIYMA
jgi:hypothetical protein